MKSLALLSGALFLVGAAVQQANLPAPLAKHLDKLSTSPSITVTYNFRVIGETPSEYKLTLSKPNLFRLSSADGFTLSDGKTIYTYTKKDNRYTETPLTDDSIAEFSRRPEVFAWADFLAKKPGEGIAIAKATPDRTVQGSEVSPVELTMKKNSTSGTIFVDKKLSLARGYAVKIADKDYLAMATSIEIGKEPVAADQFAFVAPAGAQKASAVDTETPTYAQVQEILSANCMPCHSSQGKRGGYDLSSYDGVVASVVPGQSANSPLIRSLHATGSARMPKGRAPLSDTQIAILSRWIDAGAKK